MSIDIALNDADNASLPTGLEAVIKANNDIIEEALKKGLNRESSEGPNFMLVDLDMNSFRILNVGEPRGPNDLVRRRDVSLIQAGIFRKNDTTGALEISVDGGQSFTVLFELEELRGRPGLDGNGSGDLRSVNNLSDVTSAATARSNIGAQPVGNYALSDDPRFDRYEVIALNDGNNSAPEWGKLYYKYGTGDGLLTLSEGLPGCVNTIVNNRASGDLTIEMEVGGPGLFIAGEPTIRPIVLAPAGMVSVVNLDGSTVVVTGVGIKV